LLFSGFATNWQPPPGHSQPQKAFRKTNPEMNTAMIAITLIFITPALRLIMGGAGARYKTVIGNKENETNWINILIVCLFITSKN
jgi:hypothetical protein